jgi:hypothetical protein
MGYRAFMVGYESRSDGAVILTNGDRAGQLVDEILRSVAASISGQTSIPLNDQQ